MTDADRLRQAADRLDKTWPRLEWANQWIAEDGYPSVGYYSANSFSEKVQALLRAVALMQEEYLDNTGNPRIFKALPIYNTAHALADEILGDTND